MTINHPSADLLLMPRPTIAVAELCAWFIFFERQLFTPAWKYLCDMTMFARYFPSVSNRAEGSKTVADLKCRRNEAPANNAMAEREGFEPSIQVLARITV
jgi:hypothetical protein